MAKRDCNRHGRYAPSLARTRRMIFQERCEEIDEEMRKKNNPKKESKKGPRAEFLAKYKQEGYDAAEAMIHSTPTGRKAFPKEILKRWIEEEQDQ